MSTVGPAPRSGDSVTGAPEGCTSDRGQCWAATIAHRQRRAAPRRLRDHQALRPPHRSARREPADRCGRSGRPGRRERRGQVVARGLHRPHPRARGGRGPARRGAAPLDARSGAPGRGRGVVAGPRAVRRPRRRRQRLPGPRAGSVADRREPDAPERRVGAAAGGGRDAAARPARARAVARSAAARGPRSRAHERPAGGAARRAHGGARRRRDVAGAGRDPPVPRRRGGHPAGDPRPRSGLRARGPGGRAPRRPRRGRRLAARGAPRRHRGAHVGHRDGLDGPTPAAAAAEPGRPAVRRRARGLAAPDRLRDGRGARPGDALRAPARRARWRPRGAAPPRGRRSARAAARGERSARARRRRRLRGAGRGGGRGRRRRGPVHAPGARALPPSRSRVGHPQRVGRADRRNPRRAGDGVGLRHLGRPARAGTARAGAASTWATWRRPSNRSGCCPRSPGATASSSRCAGCSRRWPGPTGWKAAWACRCWS